MIGESIEGMTSPNIVLVTIDSLRADSLGSRTPFIAKLAHRGLSFTQAVSNASWTNPSLKSMLTSTCPLEGGWHPLGGPETRLISRLEPWRTSLALRLKEAGYTTVGALTNPMIDPTLGFGRGFDHITRPLSRELAPLTSPSRSPSRSARYLESVGKALGYLNRQLRSSKLRRHYLALTDLVRYTTEISSLLPERLMPSPEPTGISLNFKLGSILSDLKERPLFIWIHYMDTHFPYVPPDAKSGEKYRALLARWAMPNSGWGELPPEESESVLRMRHYYLGCVGYVDRMIKNLFSLCEENSLNEKNTVYVITSDHGQEFMEHGRWAHSDHLYDENIRVPLIFFGERFRSSVLSDQQVSLIDVVPTLLDIIGHGEKRSCGGKSLLPALQASLRRDWAISESPLFCPPGDANGKKRQPALKFADQRYSIRTVRWKYILTFFHDSEGTSELYDLQSDPMETRNLALEMKSLELLFRRAVLVHVRQHATHRR
jgi:arylsulfatase A-like enzyme